MFNIVATHLQAWPSEEAASADIIRLRQLKELKQIIYQMHINKNEPLIYQGDFNVDYFKYKDVVICMAQQLGAILPKLIGNQIFTSDPSTNYFVGMSGEATDCEPSFDSCKENTCLRYPGGEEPVPEEVFDLFKNVSNIEELVNALQKFWERIQNTSKTKPLEITQDEFMFHTEEKMRHLCRSEYAKHDVFTRLQHDRKKVDYLPQVNSIYTKIINAMKEREKKFSHKCIDKDEIIKSITDLKNSEDGVCFSALRYSPLCKEEKDSNKYFQNFENCLLEVYKNNKNKIIESLETCSCTCCPHELLDYILYDENAKQPFSSSIEIIRAKHPTSSLEFSDHYPMLGIFQFNVDKSRGGASKYRCPRCHSQFD